MLCSRQIPRAYAQTVTERTHTDDDGQAEEPPRRTAGAANDWTLGLLGGTATMRAKHGRAPRLEHRYLLRYPAESPSPLQAWLRDARPLEVEIGFGRGRYLAELANRKPEGQFLGFEVKTKGCAELLSRVDNYELSNVRISQCDARPVLAYECLEGSLDAVHVNFPDPWWKKRHRRRLIFTDEFIAVIESRLKGDGAIYFRTDVRDYATAVLDQFRRLGRFDQRDVADDELPMTHRELKCIDFGLPVYRYAFHRRPVDSATQREE